MLEIVYVFLILNIFRGKSDALDENIVISKSTGYIDFNSTKYNRNFTRQQWIIQAPTSNESESENKWNQTLPHCRIFVEEIQLSVEGNLCPIDRRVVIGDSETALEGGSIAYCRKLRNFELNIFAGRIHIQLLTPDNLDEIIIRLHFGFVTSSGHLLYIQTQTYEPCTYKPNQVIPNILFRRLWACRSIHTGLISETKCLSVDNICDGYLDCPTGEDESETTCNIETVTLLDNLRKLEKKYLVQNERNVSNFKIVTNYLLKNLKNVENECNANNQDVNISKFGNSTLPSVPMMNECPFGTYACLRDSTCLEHIYVCDGRQDCFNNSDETEHACKWRAELNSANSSDADRTNSISHDYKFVKWDLSSRLCRNKFTFFCRKLYACLPFEYMCNELDVCPISENENKMACDVIHNKLYLPQNKSAEEYCQSDMIIPQWIAEIYSNQFFSCLGVLIQGGMGTAWILIPSSCAGFTRDDKITVKISNSSRSYEVDLPRIRNGRRIRITFNEFSLLKLRLGEPGTDFRNAESPSGINLNLSDHLSITETQVLITPLVCQMDNIKFAFQRTHLLPYEMCQTNYNKLNKMSPSMRNTSACIKQSFCIQRSMNSILISLNPMTNVPSFLGFVVYGSDCFLGQIGWPALVVMVTWDKYQWIIKETGQKLEKTENETACGLAPMNFFSWYTYFNITSTKSYCLGIRVDNESFPLITSAQCLRQCIQANETSNGCVIVNIDKLLFEDHDSKISKHWEEGAHMRTKLSENSKHRTEHICPAKNAIRAPWIRCLVVYLSDVHSNSIFIDEVHVHPFSRCASEPFYTPLLQNESLCIEGLHDERLNCLEWRDSGIVQCLDQDTNQWQLVGLAPSCSNHTTTRWLLRIMYL